MNPTRTIMSLLARVSPLQMLILIAALAAVTTWYVGHEINDRLATQPSAPVVVTPAKTSIVFCTKNINEGDLVHNEDLELREVEASRAPVDAVMDPNDAIGHSAKFSVMAGAPLAQRDLAPVLGMNGFQSKLRPGERAVTLAVDSNTGVAGFISPDSRVDVMVQVGSGAETKTKPILSDVRVLASGTTYKKLPGETKAEPTSNVTVAVTPAEASKLINGMSAGHIYLTLRSDSDHTPLAVSDVNSLFRKPIQVPAPLLTELPPPPMPLNMQAEAPKIASSPSAPAAPSLHEIEQWQGSKRDVATVHQQ
jgi:pilus assembly protein CpaB